MATADGIMLSELIEQGGPVMIPLLACSLLALAVTVERILFWFSETRRARVDEVERAFGYLREQDLDRFLSVAADTRNPIITTFTRALAHGSRTLGEALALETNVEIEKTRRFLTLLDTIVTLSPLLGIFGTVVGIIQSFDVMGQTEMASPKAVSAGMATALVTTAAGLAIAMPSLLAYNLLMAQSNRFAFHLERYAGEFEILTERWQQLYSMDEWDAALSRLWTPVEEFD
jgi:biopolymer transport protein ExbB